MKFIFCLLICFLSLNSSELEYIASFKINNNLELKIYVQDYEYGDVNFRIVDENNKIIYENDKPDNYIDFEKLNENYIFITKSSAGRCCGATYIILEIEKQKLKNVRNLDFAKCGINTIFVNKKNELEFTAHDCAFESLIPAPELIFKNYKINIEKMKKNYFSNYWIENMQEIIKKDNDVEKLLSLEYSIVNLIYTGKINSAFELYNDYDRVFPNKENLVLLRKIFINFQKSRFFGEILNVNNMSIVEFENLMKKNKIEIY